MKPPGSSAQLLTSSGRPLQPGQPVSALADTVWTCLPAVPCSFFLSPAGELAIFWDLITGSPRAFQPITGLLAGRVTWACCDDQQLPCLVAVPSGQPTLLGLLSICLSKACLGPILQDQRANGENILSKKMMRESEQCRQGVSQQEGALLEG